MPDGRARPPVQPRARRHVAHHTTGVAGPERRQRLPQVSRHMNPAVLLQTQAESPGAGPDPRDIVAAYHHHGIIDIPVTRRHHAAHLLSDPAWSSYTCRDHNAAPRSNGVTASPPSTGCRRRTFTACTFSGDGPLLT